ncbi:MAG: twin transmembrane helix small protein [Gammaproteobacteria bacterium]|nr:twin transmembrane helix small protein [Gammaproteobacteria bacterium]
MSKVLVIGIFCLIVASLASGALTLVRGREGDSKKMAKALTMRISLSIALFILLFLLWAAGVIQPHSAF